MEIREIREYMKKRLQQKLHSDRGVILPIVILSIAVIAALVLFVVIPGYQEHLRNAKIQADVQTVATAKDVASVTYLQDGGGDLVTYYYDELSHKCLLRKDIDRIEPYGRCSAKDNKNNVTGAKGVPNFGDNGGAQLLAITIADGTIINVRWTGKKYTVLDYDLMTIRERNALDAEARDEIEKDRERIRKESESGEAGTQSEDTAPGSEKSLENETEVSREKDLGTGNGTEKEETAE